MPVGSRHSPAIAAPPSRLEKIVYFARSAVSAIPDAVAGYVLYARVLQSVMHMLGTSLPLVALRGLFYFVQVVLIFYMLWGLLRA